MYPDTVTGELYLDGEKIGDIQELSFEEHLAKTYQEKGDEGYKEAIEDEYKRLDSFLSKIEKPLKISLKIELSQLFIDMIEKDIEEMKSKDKQ